MSSILAPLLPLLTIPYFCFLYFYYTFHSKNRNKYSISTTKSLIFINSLDYFLVNQFITIKYLYVTIKALPLHSQRASHSMQSDNNQGYKSENPISPGNQLLMELNGRGLSQKDLADAIDKPTPMINEIIKGNRRFSAEMSALIGIALDMPSDFWINLQVQYEISRVKQEEQFDIKAQSIRDWNRLKEIINVGYLKKKFELTNDTIECVNKIFSYFGVNNINEFDNKAQSLFTAFYRKSERSQIDSINLLTWIMISKHDSESYPGKISKFDRRKEKELISELNNVFLLNTDTIYKTTAILEKYGIKYLTEEKLDKLPIDGYSFWLGDNPTIVMTKRFDRIDNYAFTLMHEIGHVFMHLSPSQKNDSIDIYIDEQREKLEKQADDYAVQGLLGDAPISELYTRYKNPFAADSEIIRFAKQYNIHRSIIAGQYRNHFNAYSACSRLIDKIG